jgi:hypothetical protein
MRQWWVGFLWWVYGCTVSLATIQIKGDPVKGVRRLRKGLRDVRDRTARRRSAWRLVTFCGLLSGNEALVLVQHTGIDPMSVWSVLKRRWPEIVVQNVHDNEPLWQMTVDDAAALARLKRGVEPIRVVVPAQRVLTTAPQEKWVEPMPILW